jgi:starch synthase (maltosyl-transferring)
VAEIRALNRARARNPALQSALGVTFLTARNDAILYYEKATPDRANVVLAAVSLDPHNTQSADFEVPTWRWQLADDGAVAAEDLMTGERFIWRGKDQRVTLTPERPFRLWRARPAAHG